MAQTSLRPELARSLEASLALPTSRFDRATANGPTAIRYRLVVHSPRLTGKIVLFLAHHLTQLPPGSLQRRNLLQHPALPPVPQPMQASLHPALGPGFFCALTRSSQRPEMFAAMVEVQQLLGLGPAILRQIPNPGTPVGQYQQLLGSG